VARHTRRYRRIARSLSSAELRDAPIQTLFDAQDLLGWREPDPRFLDFYGDEGLRLALERYGITREAEKRGYAQLDLETHCDDERHTLLVFGSDADGLRHRIAEAVVRRDRLLPHPDEAQDPALATAYDVLTVDWLVLRNPLARFTSERPRLPGQDAPGLGLGEQVFELLCRAVERLSLDALVSTAQHFHNAVLYVTRMPFLDPRWAGQLHALVHRLMLREGLSLAQASWAVEWGLVHAEGSPEPFRWRGELQLWPRAPTLERFVKAEAYFRRVATATADWHFRLDRPAFDERWEAERAALTDWRAPR
jgi:hypothetical protein